MLLQLVPHPSSTCDSVERLEVDMLRPDAGTLSLRYVLSGAVSDLALPAQTAPARADELWRHTCFEAFIGPLQGPAYCEFNFAPSGQWAAYAFSGYREGMRVAGEIGPPGIKVRSGNGELELLATLNLRDMAILPNDAPWRLGLAAVIEETSGRKSHWALTHPPGKPDFHHRDGFTQTIAPPQGS